MRCESSNVCVPLAMKCDGWKDCVGGEDEQVASSRLIRMRMYCFRTALRIQPTNRRTTNITTQDIITKCREWQWLARMERRRNSVCKKIFINHWRILNRKALTMYIFLEYFWSKRSNLRNDFEYTTANDKWRTNARAERTQICRNEIANIKTREIFLKSKK